MSDSREQKIGYAHVPTDPDSEIDDGPSEERSQIRSRTLLSSSMLSASNLTVQTGSTSDTGSNSQAQPRDVSFSFVEEQQSAPESARDISDTKASAMVTKFAVSSFPSITQLKAIKEMTKIKELSAIKEMAKIREVANLKNLKHVAAVVADYIPVVGNSRVHRHASGVRRIRQPMDSVDADELAESPLHRACALSASMSMSVSNSTRSMYGGDLASIKLLVEEDPTQLHAQLPTSKDTPLHLAIRFGATAWLQTQDYPGSTSNLAVVEYLINADIDYLRKQAIRKRKEAGSTSPIDLGSLIVKSSVYKRDIREELPLHTAVIEGYEGAARVLLEIDKDAYYDTILAKDVDGNLPLHLAVRGDDLVLVKLLLEADSKREELRLQKRQSSTSGIGKHQKETKTLSTLVTPNDEGNIPLHLALSSVHRFVMWGLLLDHDDDKETLHLHNLQDETAFRFFADRPHMCNDECSFVDEHLAEALLERLLSGKRLEPWDDHLKRSVSNSTRMQIAMNEAASNRLPVIIFMADLYAHLVTVALLFLGTDNYLRTDGKRQLAWASEVVFILVAYFAMRELVQLFLSRGLYWNDIWNYMDIVRVGMLFLMALMMHGNYGNPYDNNTRDEYVTRRMLLAMGVFIYMGFVSFLRMTYKPFALFVGGTTQIVLALIPFMITFLLVLALFAYGYWVGGAISEFSGEQGYPSWLLEIFMSAMNGPESLAVMDVPYIDGTAWTVLFMVLVQLLLLNVVIAVITSAWEDITEQETQVFWKYRLEYAAGVLPMERFLRTYFGNTFPYWIIAKLCEFIDKLDGKGLHDRVNWDVYPYCLVLQQRELYWDKDRFARLVSDDLKAQRESHRPPSMILSPLSSRYQEDRLKMQRNKSLRKWKQMHSFEADIRFGRSTFGRVCTRLQLLCFYFLYVVAFFAGFVTLGFCWPRKVRTLVCAGVTTFDADEDEHYEKPKSSSDELSSKPGFVDQDRYVALEKKVDEMKETIDALHRSIEQLVILHTTTQSETAGD